MHYTNVCYVLCTVFYPPRGAIFMDQTHIGPGDIAHHNSDGQTDTQTDARTDNLSAICLRQLSMAEA